MYKQISTTILTTVFLLLSVSLLSCPYCDETEPELNIPELGPDDSDCFDINMNCVGNCNSNIIPLDCIIDGYTDFCFNISPCRIGANEVVVTIGQDTIIRRLFEGISQWHDFEFCLSNALLEGLDDRFYELEDLPPITISARNFLLPGLFHFASESVSFSRWKIILTGNTVLGERIGEDVIASLPVSTALVHCLGEEPLQISSGQSVSFKTGGKVQYSAGAGINTPVSLSFNTSVSFQYSWGVDQSFSLGIGTQPPPVSPSDCINADECCLKCCFNYHVRQNVLIGIYNGIHYDCLGEPSDANEPINVVERFGNLEYLIGQSRNCPDDEVIEEWHYDQEEEKCKRDLCDIYHEKLEEGVESDPAIEISFENQTCYKRIFCGEDELLQVFNDEPSYSNSFFDPIDEICYRYILCFEEVMLQEDIGISDIDWTYDEFSGECIGKVHCNGLYEENFHDQITEFPSSFGFWEQSFDWQNCVRDVNCTHTVSGISGIVENGDTQEPEITWEYDDFLDRCIGHFYCGNDEILNANLPYVLPNYGPWEFNYENNRCERSASCNGDTSIDTDIFTSNAVTSDPNPIDGLYTCEVNINCQGNPVITYTCDQMPLGTPCDISFFPFDCLLYINQEINPISGINYTIPDDYSDLLIYPNPTNSFIELVVDNINGRTNRIEVVSINNNSLIDLIEGYKKGRIYKNEILKFSPPGIYLIKQYTNQDELIIYKAIKL